MEVIENISFGDELLVKAETIYYAANTCWWTHDPAHLSRTPPATEEQIRRTADNFRLNSGRHLDPLENFMERARRAHAHRLPADPRGSVLYETNKVRGFLEAAETHPEFYGRHGLRAFMATHHLNCILSLDDPRPWSESKWDAYNDALDRLDARKA